MMNRGDALIASLVIAGHFLAFGVGFGVGNAERAVSSGGEGQEQPACVIPNLPEWNELVLRLWGSGRVTEATFKAQFPVSGEHGDKHLRMQGYAPEELEGLANCLVNTFRRKPNG